MMKKNSKKAFTLIELIIVIAIIAILAVTAGLMLTKWIGKSKDARVLADLGTIEKALQIHYADKMNYPTPGDYIYFIVSGVNYTFTEGLLDESVTSQLTELSKTPKHPYGLPKGSDNKYYYYAKDNNDNKYQLAAQLGNGKWVLKGNYEYIAVASGTKNNATVASLPSLFVVDTEGNILGNTDLLSGHDYNFIMNNNTVTSYTQKRWDNVDLTNGNVITNIYNNLPYTGNIDGDALHNQLLEQVSK